MGVTNKEYRMDMNQGMPQSEMADKPEMGGDMKSKMAQAIKLLQECMDMAGGDERLSVEQAFGQGFRGDSVDKPY
jgi:hypothetical protein